MKSPKYPQSSDDRIIKKTSLNDILLSFEDPISVLQVPNDCSPEYQEHTNFMTACLLQLDASSDPNNHLKLYDLSKLCLICKKAGHTFADCPVLNSIKVLKTALLISIMLKVILVSKTVVPKSMLQTQGRPEVRVYSVSLRVFGPNVVYLVQEKK